MAEATREIHIHLGGNERFEKLIQTGDLMAGIFLESEEAEDRLLGREWCEALGTCPVCRGRLEPGNEGPECAPEGCPSRDGSDA